MVDLGYLGDRGSYATGINNKGQVIGYSWVALGREHAFLWTKKNGMIDLGTLDTLGGPSEATVSRAVGINNKGHVVGWSSFGTIKHAFLWTKKDRMVDLGTLGGTYSTAVGINNKGHVTGTSSTASGDEHAFIWTKKDGMVDLGTLGGTYSTAVGINNKGQVAGTSSIIEERAHAFLWTPITNFVIRERVLSRAERIDETV